MTATVFDKEEWPITRAEEEKDYYGLSNEVTVYDDGDVQNERVVYIDIPAGFFTYVKSISVQNLKALHFVLENSGGVYFFSVCNVLGGDRMFLDLWSYDRLPAWAKK